MIRWLGQQEIDPSELLRRLPSCYSEEFQLCFDAFDSPNADPNTFTPECKKYYDLRASTSRMVWDAALEAMPYCPAPKAEKSKTAPLWLLGAGFAGLFLGTLIR